MIRLVLVDDHPVVAQGLRAILDDHADLEVAALARDANEAERLIRLHRPDVVLLDLELPGRSGLDAFPGLVRTHPGARFIILSAYGGSERIVRAVRGGARSYLLKGASALDIVSTIRAVAAGETSFSPAVARALGEELHAERASLTPRESEILRLVAQGLANKTIAVRLGITERTVKYHVSEILGRLGAKNRAEAVALAQQRTLL